MSNSVSMDLEQRPEVLEAFREAWAEADSLGLEGQRVAWGLAAALNALEGTPPVGRFVVVDREVFQSAVNVIFSSFKVIVGPAVNYARKMGLLEGTGL